LPSDFSGVSEPSSLSREAGAAKTIFLFSLCGPAKYHMRACVRYNGIFRRSYFEPATRAAKWLLDKEAAMGDFMLTAGVISQNLYWVGAIFATPGLPKIQHPYQILPRC
jgi:hypothetical protein